MTLKKCLGSILTVLLVVFCISVVTNTASAQSTDRQADAGVDLETQLYLLVGTDQAAGDQKLPSVLDPVVKQLRTSLPFKNYQLAATLINRVKNNGRLNLRWVGGPMLSTAAATANTPSFNDFRINNVSMKTNEKGDVIIQMDGFAFGARVPIILSSQVASAGPPPRPVINYENTGLNTDISIKEGQPAVVGTVNLGPSGEAIILVISAHRASK